MMMIQDGVNGYSARGISGVVIDCANVHHLIIRGSEGRQAGSRYLAAGSSQRIDESMRNKDPL